MTEVKITLTMAAAQYVALALELKADELPFPLTAKAISGDIAHALAEAERLS